MSFNFNLQAISIIGQKKAFQGLAVRRKKLLT